MDQRSLRNFALVALLSVAVLILASAFLLPHSFFANTVSTTDKNGAKEALSLLKDWAVWMAGIQTATIAALGLLAKDGAPTLKLTAVQSRLAVLVALFNTLALFFSAWLLTSLSSLMLRVYQEGRLNFDFYNWPLYAYMEHTPSMKVFTVGFFAFWNHWLWGIGILLFGAFSISMIGRHRET